MNRTKKLDYAVKFATFCRQIDLSPPTCADIVELAEDAMKSVKMQGQETNYVKRLREYCKKFGLNVSNDCTKLIDCSGKDEFQIP